MSAIQIKNVPPDVHDALRARAASAGKSLQEYLLGLLRAEVELPTATEWFADIRADRADRVDGVVDALQQGREERGKQLGDIAVDRP